MENFILTLVAPRQKYSLSNEHIETAREILSSSLPLTVLSEGEAVDIPCQTSQANHVRQKIKDVLGGKLDFSLRQPANRQKKILISDMDSTIVANETLDEVAAIAGVGEHVANITKQSMQGQQDFTHSLEERVALLEGQPKSILEDAWHKIKLVPGAKQLVATLNKRHVYTVLISGGFTFFTQRIAKICGFDEHYANQFVFTPDDKLSGKVGNKPIDGEKKKEITQTIAHKKGLSHKDVLSIGDGSNDIPMLEYADMGIAFHGKDIVKEKIPLQINHTSLETALFMQGIPRRDFVETTPS